MSDYKLDRLTDYCWEIPAQGKMRVPARIYAAPQMLDHILSDNAPQQAMHVAHLPGIVKASLAMPDIHWGYGFPIGGVAAFDINEGVVSPGGVGYDINCGVRLMATHLDRHFLQPKIGTVIRALFNQVPTGVGASVKGKGKVTQPELRRVVQQGAEWAVKEGLGEAEDLEYIEEGGCVEGSDPDQVSQRAWERGLAQLGTLGSGNHFLEVGYVSEIYDRQAARVLGIEEDQVTLIIHCGSRGFGYQVCDDFLSLMDKAIQKYSIDLPDRQLACAPIQSEEGRSYLGAMRCAINYAFANREVIAHRTREAIQGALGISPRDLGARTVYEVAHNIAKIEEHEVEGRRRRLCVHRKGATRAFGPNQPEVPSAYQSVGQPVLVPGDMGRYSYVLVGTGQAMNETFGSTCHGAGRAMSRHQAKKTARGRDITRELEKKGIMVIGQSYRTLAEEISEAYKDVSDVVNACQGAGISRKVAQLRPMGCIKG